MTEMTPLFPADANGVARGLIRHSPTDSVYRVEMEQEEDGRWLAEITDLPGVMAYGRSEQEALRRTLALALRVVAERVENDEHDLTSDSLPFSFDRS
jgi:predicted RNase H-like HicB family nuclease